MPAEFQFRTLYDGCLMPCTYYYECMEQTQLRNIFWLVYSVLLSNTALASCLGQVFACPSGKVRKLSLYVVWKPGEGSVKVLSG